MSDSLLHPERFGVDSDCGIGYGRNVLGAAEYVDDVDRNRNVFQASIRFVAEHFGFVGIHRNDLIADRLEIGSDFMRRAMGLRGKADDGDGFGIAKKIGDRVRGFRRVFREIEFHQFVG